MKRDTVALSEQRTEFHTPRYDLARGTIRRGLCKRDHPTDSGSGAYFAANGYGIVLIPSLLAAFIHHAPDYSTQFQPSDKYELDGHATGHSSTSHSESRDTPHTSTSLRCITFRHVPVRTEKQA